MSRQPVRRSPPRRPGAPRRKTSFGDRLIAKLPVSHDTLRKMVTWIFLGVGGAAAVAGATWFGVPGMIGSAIAESTGRAGMRVEQVDITGLKKMDRETVYAVALENQAAERPLLAVDLDAVRKRLLAYGWIADAYVSRRFPDRLLIHIVEREPAAIWQNEGQLTLIDANGVLLAPIDADHMPAGLPLVIGPGAIARRRPGAPPADQGGDLGRQPALGSHLRQRRDLAAAAGQCAGGARQICRDGRRQALAGQGLGAFRYARSK